MKLPMTPPLKKVLDGLGIAAGPLFWWPDGRIIHRFPRKAWARACVKAGPYVQKPDPKHPRTHRKVPAIRFRDLRHCMGTVLAEASVVFAGIVRTPFVRFAALTAISNLGIALGYAAFGAFSMRLDSFLVAFLGALLLPGIALGISRLTFGRMRHG